MTQVTTNSLGIIQWDAIPSEPGHIGAGIKNAWEGPEIYMWHEHFVCAGPDGWHLWLHVLFEQDRTSWWQHRGEEYASDDRKPLVLTASVDASDIIFYDNDRSVP